MNTPKTIQTALGLSGDMIRYYVKGYYESIGKSVRYSNKMELNGSTNGVLHYIIEKAKDESIREKAKHELNGTNRTDGTDLTNEPNGTTQNNAEQDGTNRRNEEAEAERKELAERANELTERVLQANVEIREANERNERMEEENERLRAEHEQQVKELEQRVEGLKNSLARITAEQAEKAKAWIRDIGNYVLSSPNVKFLFVLILVSAQAYLFAMLEEKVLTGIEIEIKLWAAFVVGILFEASGFMIARQFPSAKGVGTFSTRDWWLVIFFSFQCVTNLCLFLPWETNTIAEGIGRTIVALAAPIGLLAYSFLYFQTSE